MQFGRVHLSPRMVRAAAIFFGVVLLYIIALDGQVRPPLRQMTFEDFEEADSFIQHTNATTDKPSRILIVSAMFPLAKSKHSKADYRVWLDRFLGQITTEIYMYTTPDLAEFIQSVRGPLPITIDTTYDSPFKVPPLVDLEETYTRMNDMDKEKFHHSPGLYAVWNAKPFLLDSAVKILREKGKEYDYAFWNDGGSFRRVHHYDAWPDSARVDQIWEEGSKLTGAPKEDLLFFPVFQPPTNNWKTWKESDGPIANSVQFSEGSFFGGTASTITWFSDVFYTYHNHYLARGLFVGIDQDIFNSIFLLFPERIFTVWMNDPDAPAHQGITPSPSLIPSLERGYLGECGMEWFYYQFWLADRASRDEMRTTWIQQERWRKSGWWKERKLCRMTRAMSMLHFLRTSFGDKWNPPPRTLHVPGRVSA